MSSSAKVLIGIAAVIVLLCVGAGIVLVGSVGAMGMFVSRTVQSEPGKVAATAAKIAEFTLPSGYGPEAAVEIAGYQFVSYAPGDGHSHIMLIQVPKGALADQATLEQYLQQATPSRNSDRRIRSTVVGQTQATVRGQKVTLVLSEGTNSDGQPYRTLTGVFQGRGGPALLSIESPASTWNQDTVNAFVASIR